MKLRRHAAILRVIHARRIRSQEDLRRAIAGLGFKVTQATLSRDVHDLGLARLVDEKGAYYAQPDEGGVRPGFQSVLSALLTGIDIRRAYLLAFAVGTGLAGAAGTLVSVSYSVSPSIGLEWTLKALIVVVLAGLGSMIGFDVLARRGSDEILQGGAGPVIQRAHQKGLLILSCGTYSESIRLIFPLTAPAALVEEGLNLLEEALRPV